MSQFIVTTYPVIDDDLPPEMHSEFAGWLLLSDANLWEIAKSRFDEAKQDKLGALYLVERLKI